MTGLRTAPAIPWFREPLVWLVIGIPLSSVIMGVVLITLAVTSYDGLVVDDYYKRGLQINRVLDRDSAALKAALSGRTRFAADGTRLLLESAVPGTVLPPSVTLLLSYSTRSGRDQSVVLSRRSPGEYQGDGVELAPGRWYVEVGTPQWRLTGRLDAPRQRELVMRAGE